MARIDWRRARKHRGWTVVVDDERERMKTDAAGQWLSRGNGNLHIAKGSNLPRGLGIIEEELGQDYPPWEVRDER